VRLSASELRSLQIDSTKNKDALVYCILTIPDDVSRMTANLKAPLVINSASQQARQVVLQENEYSVKYSMYKELLGVIMSSLSATAGAKSLAAEAEVQNAAAPLALREASTKVEVSAL